MLDSYAEIRIFNVEDKPTKHFLEKREQKSELMSCEKSNDHSH